MSDEEEKVSKAGIHLATEEHHDNIIRVDDVQLNGSGVHKKNQLDDKDV